MTTSSVRAPEHPTAVPPAAIDEAVTKVRVRRCIATGEVGDRSSMLRFVLGPDDILVADVSGRLPGRGVWVRADAAALALACRRGLFAKSLRCRVSVPADMAKQVERLLRRQCIELLGLANRSSLATCGHDRVRIWLAGGRAAVLLAARDGSPAECARMRASATGLTVVGGLDASELGRAFGRERVVHAAVAAGKLADRLVAAAARLDGIVGDEGRTAGNNDQVVFSTGQR